MGARFDDYRDRAAECGHEGSSVSRRLYALYRRKPSGGKLERGREESRTLCRIDHQTHEQATPPPTTPPTPPPQNKSNSTKRRQPVSRQALLLSSNADYIHSITDNLARGARHCRHAATPALGGSGRSTSSSTAFPEFASSTCMRVLAARSGKANRSNSSQRKSCRHSRGFRHRQEWLQAGTGIPFASTGRKNHGKENGKGACWSSNQPSCWSERSPSRLGGASAAIGALLLPPQQNPVTIPRPRFGRRQ